MNDAVFYTFQRATGVRPNPQEFATRANAAINGAANSGPTSLIVHRTPGGYSTFFAVSESAARSKKGLELAQAYGARAKEVDQLPDSILSVPYIVKLVFRSAEHGIDTQYGADPAEMARGLSQAMPDESWVGFSVRRAKRMEITRNRRYVNHRMGANLRHVSKTKSAVVFSVYVGAQTRSEAITLARELPEMMTGFDIDARASSVTHINMKAAAALGLGVAAGALTKLAHAVFDQLPEPMVRAGWLVSGVLLAIAVFGLIVGSPKRKVYRRLQHGFLPQPPQPPALVRPPRNERSKWVKDSDGVPYEKRVKEFAGDYPLKKNTFLFEPTVFAPAGNPHGSSLAGAITASDRDVTPELAQAEGPIIGKTVHGTPVPIPASSLRYSTMIFGEPGSGKSVLLQGLWGWLCKERVNPSGLLHHPGADSALVAFETKGGGVEGYLSHSALHGDKAMLVDALDPETPAIDPFDFGDLTMGEQAERMVSALQYAFEDGSIMGRSAESLRAVYHAATVADYYQIAQEDWMGDEDSHRRFDQSHVTVHDYAHALLMGHTPEAFDAIMATLSTLADRCKRDHDMDAYLEIMSAVDDMSPLMQMTPSARRSHTEAPRNKVDVLRRMNYYMRPDRPTTNFENVLRNHLAVVINVGASADEQIIDDEQSKLLSGLLMYNLRSAIQRVCMSWDDQGRSLSVLCDEFSMLAGSNDDVLMWFRDQGRVFGVRMFFATQFPAQLSHNMRENVFGYHTVATYTMGSNTPSEVVAKELSEDVSGEEIRNLAKYHLLMLTNVDDEIQPPVTVVVHNFNEDVLL